MNEAWEKKWTELVASAMDPAKEGRTHPRHLVFVDGKLMTESRFNRPGDYVWLETPGPGVLPVFKHPLRNASVISVVMMLGGVSGLTVNDRYDYVVTAKLAGAGEPVPVSLIP